MSEEQSPDRVLRVPLHRAVLLAAGKGTRLGELTENFPKPLLEVGGRPIIVHILDGLLSAGIDDVSIVTGHAGDILEREIGNGGASGLRIRYERQETPDGTARALALAREHLSGDQFFFGWGDILVPSHDYRAVIRASRFADATIAVNYVRDPFAGAAVYIEPPAGDAASGKPETQGGKVTRIVEKPPRGTSTTHWNNAGFGVLGPSIWPKIHALQPSARGEYELPEAIAALVEDGATVRAVPIEGQWFDIGTPEELETARAAYSRGGARYDD
ncbi:MAG: nucleotidyltransferase family protein [Tepidiformaceae bacterium]